MPSGKKRLGYDPLSVLVGEADPAAAGPVTELPLDAIGPNPQQPRTYYDPTEQAELEASIREQGIHQPLIVRELPAGRFELVAGSRRLEAARRVGLDVAPVVVRRYTDAEAEAVALLENVQRARLRFDDEARGLLGLKRRHGLTNAEIGQRLGKSADYVELRVAAAEHPAVLDLYVQGRLDQTEIRAAVRELRETGALAGAAAALAGPPPAADPKASDAPAPARPGRRPPDGWRWAGDVERRLQQLPSRAPRMDAAERARAREYLLRLREAADTALARLAP
jgi:ParB/RepB/Spo0J family partition protein